MHRFFVSPELVQHATPGTHIQLSSPLAHQVRDVLRLANDEQLVLLDNTGEEFVARVSKTSKVVVEVEIVTRQKGKEESHVRITLCQGLMKSARFEWILEKGTELGVSTFAPMQCRRSLSGLENAGASKVQRWQHIVQEAAEQCGRARLPELLPIRPFETLLTHIPTGTLTLIPWEEERTQSLRDVLRANMREGEGPEAIMVFIGPEGGLTPEEIQLAQRSGVQPVTLGQRILRAETAALAAISSVMYELE
jgi:16S rRNA (uracil1498-N3)-methyltransferase